MCYIFFAPHTTHCAYQALLTMVTLQFIVNDTKTYNYNGEIEEKLKDMGRPNLVKIRQKQASFVVFVVTATRR